MPTSPQPSQTGEQDDFGLSWQGMIIAFALFCLMIGAAGLFFAKYEGTPLMNKIIQKEVDSREWYGERTSQSDLGAVSGVYLAASAGISWFVGYKLTRRFFRKSRAATEPLPVWATLLITLVLVGFAVLIVIMANWIEGYL